jgi:hypothetical protein
VKGRWKSSKYEQQVNKPLKDEKIWKREKKRKM